MIILIFLLQNDEKILIFIFLGNTNSRQRVKTMQGIHSLNGLML